jgi:hypothetical protein
LYIIYIMPKKSTLSKGKKILEKKTGDVVDFLNKQTKNPLKYLQVKRSKKSKGKRGKKSTNKYVKKTESVVGSSVDFLNKETGKPLIYLKGGKKYKGGTKTKKKSKKKSKYNIFMGCEIKRLKRLSENKVKKHNVVFKMAAKNWSKKSKK